MSVVFLSLLLIFEFMQQAALGKFHVVFKHFQNLENLISNILNLLPCKLRIAQC